jgi:diacylglycerol kinase family enzyme
MPGPLDIGIVFNPRARAGTDQSTRLKSLESALRLSGHRIQKRETSAPGQGADCARQLIDQVDVILALGGDGTFCEVVGGMLATPHPRAKCVAPVSFGTGNDVAAHLGLSADHHLLAALARFDPSHPALIGSHSCDVLEIRCRSGGRDVVRHGFLFAAVGFASDILRHTTPSVKRWFGQHLSYPVGFFRALAKWHPVELRVRTERGEVIEPLVVALAANAPHAGGGVMRIAPDASLTDGLADVSLVRALGRWTLAGQFFRLVRGTHVHHPRVDHFRSPWMEVDAATPQPVAVDGDVVGETPMHVRILPSAIRVLG